MSWSKKRHSLKSQRESWAEEVIAAAMRTANEKLDISDDHFHHQEGGEDDPKTDYDDDEGIVSDESSPPSSSNDEILLEEIEEIMPFDETTETRFTPLKDKFHKSKSTMYLHEKGGKGHHQSTNNSNVVRFLRSLVLSSKHGGRKSKSRVFGRDLRLHLGEVRQDIPPILRVCSKCIEHRGIVDGIYRLSGISSNIRALKSAFESSLAKNRYYEDKDVDVVAFPIEVEDPNVRQDVHSVSSLLKLYFRELPDPLCTFKLYEQFLTAAKLPEDLRLSAMRKVVKFLPKEHLRTLEYLMRHLHKVSIKGHETGMTAKNLAIVWAPNLLRSKDIASNSTSSNLKDIALQAVCTEFLIKYCDLLFAPHLPTVSLEKSFELGIMQSGNEEKEIDIDREIVKRRPKSMAFVDGQFSAVDHQLTRCTSSILTSPCNYLRDQDSSPQIPQPFASSVHVLAKSRPNSTSSSSQEPSETDVDGEVDHLHLSFEQEENEMKMMSCIFDDEDEESSFSSSASSTASPSPKKEDSKREIPVKRMNFKERFIMKKKTKSEEEGRSQSKKVQRSASALFKSSVSKVIILPKKKKNEQPPISPVEPEPYKKVEEEKEAAILNGVTFSNLGQTTSGGKTMDSIPEELLADASNQQLAFDNQAYLGLAFHAQDSGLDSAPSSFDDEAPAYENIEKYENIDPPLNYQNLDFSPQQLAEEYENLKFEEEEELLFQSTYQNVDFANQPFKATPVYATLKKAPLGAPIAKAEGEDEEEEGPVYENYDFQEEAIYQNVVVSPNGKLVPATSSEEKKSRRKSLPPSTDVYAQVKMLKLSVQEVNNLISPSSGEKKQTPLVPLQPVESKLSKEQLTFSRNNNTNTSVKRCSNFKNILYKFNVMSQQQNTSGSHEKLKVAKSMSNVAAAKS